LGEEKRNGWNNIKKVGSWGKKKIVKANVIEKIKAQRLDHVIGGKYSESFWFKINNKTIS
jgi:hypothetical protein